MKQEQTADYRQQAIKELITKKAISDQNQIVHLLNQDYGIETNQTIVSRDLRKLGIVKKMVNGTLIYEMAEINVQIEILRLAVLAVEHNEAMIVVKTRPGLSTFVGDFLDQCTDLDILGCLAGENVVFIVPKTISTIFITFESICRKLQLKKIK